MKALFIKNRFKRCKKHMHTIDRENRNNAMTSDKCILKKVSSFKPLRLAIQVGLILGLAVAGISNTYAAPDDRAKAKRMHDRLTGIPPTEEVLCAMEYFIANGDPEQAAMIVMNTGAIADPNNCNGGANIDNSLSKKAFYSVSLKNFVMPWTNEEQTVLAPLNDYAATVIGIIRDDVAFDKVLSENILYYGVAGGLSPLDASSNQHYVDLEDGAYDLSSSSVLASRSQAGYIPAGAEPAGVVTTRAASLAFFSGGTNRLMWRATSMNYLCRDLEQMKDVSRTPDRIRQDVSRSPGGDSSIFLSACMGCHAGMDPLAGAYAYYDHEVLDDGTPTGHMLWKQNSEMFGGTPAVTSNPGVGAELFSANCAGAGCHTQNNIGNPSVSDITNAINSVPRMSGISPDLDFSAIVAFLNGVEEPEVVEVTAKYLINSGNFKYGYETVDNQWTNYWRDGPNAELEWGWNMRNIPASHGPGVKIASGTGAASLGYEVTSTRAFAQCQVEKVYKHVCLRDPLATESGTVDNIATAFKNDQYNMKTVFKKVAAQCMGE
jgi:hypothetical protein